MNILMVISHFSPKKGGAFTVCYNLSKKLAELGHNITILTSDWEYNLDSLDFSKTIKDKITIVPLHITMSIASMDIIPALRKWANENIKHFDIIHIHGYRSYDSTIIIHYAKKYHIPYIIQPHGSYPRILSKQSLKQIYDRLLGKSQIAHAKKIISVSEYESESFINSGIRENQISLIYNGIDIDTYNTTSIIPLVDRNQNHKIILYAGRLHQKKGIDVLLKAFKIVLDKFPMTHLHICGTGENRYVDYLHSLCNRLNIEKNVVFLGHRSNFELKQVYGSANILVYPSEYEIFGIVPFEALLCGTPVIVSSDCGCGNIIERIHAGYLTKYGDVSGLANKIEYVFSHDKEVQTTVENGIKYIQDNLSWNIIAQKNLDVYDEILKMRQRF